MTLGAFKLATMIKVSEELLTDSVFDIPGYIAREFSRRVGTAEEEAFLGSKMEYVATTENGWNAVVIGNQVGWVSGNYSKVICASPVVSLHAVQPVFIFPWSVHGYT